MSVIHPDIHRISQQMSSIAQEMGEITDINREFLELLLHPDAGAQGRVLGLPTWVVDALKSLSPEQLCTVAAVPLLLVEFAALPGTNGVGAVADYATPYGPGANLWQCELQGFVDRLLSCLWRASRREPGPAAICIGIDLQLRRKLALLSFTEMSKCSRRSAYSLQARFAGHPLFWPDLITCARSTDPLRKIASQLSALQLSVMHRPATHGNTLIVTPRSSYL